MTTNIKQAIDDLIVEYGEHPYDINNGLCEGFASGLLSRLGLKEDGERVFIQVTPSEVWDEDAKDTLTTQFARFGNHSWVVIDGISYDAECPWGTPDWRKLPIFRNLETEDTHDCRVEVNAQGFMIGKIERINYVAR